MPYEKKNMKLHTPPTPLSDTLDYYKGVNKYYGQF